MPNREEVRVRRLPSGQFTDGFQCGLDGALMRLEFRPGTAGFEPGSLVEIESERTIYLGEVYGQEENRLVIGVEHAVDRQALAALQGVWGQPAMH